MRYKNKAKGFTLVEMLTVIIIIGVLATMGANIIGKTNSDKAKFASANATLRALNGALSAYYMDNDMIYPAGKPQTGTMGQTAAGATGSTNYSFLDRYMNGQVKDLTSPWGPGVTTYEVVRSDTVGKEYIVVYVKPTTTGTAAPYNLKATGTMVDSDFGINITGALTDPDGRAYIIRVY